MSLIAPAVNAMDVEGSVLALFNEFLSGYFDGQPHTVGVLTGVTFPKAELRFQESPLPQPLDSAIGVSMVWVTHTNIRTYWDTISSVERAGLPDGVIAGQRQQRKEAHAAWMFFVRSVTAGGNDNTQKQVQDGAGKLFGLLQNPTALEPLSEKGISKIRPSAPRMAFPGQGAPQADLGYAMRVMACTGIVRWPVVSQGTDFG